MTIWNQIMRWWKGDLSNVGHKIFNRPIEIRVPMCSPEFFRQVMVNHSSSRGSDSLVVPSNSPWPGMKIWSQRKWVKYLNILHENECKTSRSMVKKLMFLTSWPQWPWNWGIARPFSNMANQGHKSNGTVVLLFIGDQTIKSQRYNMI